MVPWRSEGKSLFRKADHQAGMGEKVETFYSKQIKISIHFSTLNTKENIKPFVAEQMREAALSRTEREKMVRAFAPRARERAAEREMFAERAPVERIMGMCG